MRDLSFLKEILGFDDDLDDSDKFEPTVESLEVQDVLEAVIEAVIESVIEAVTEAVTEAVIKGLSLVDSNLMLLSVLDILVKLNKLS